MGTDQVFVRSVLPPDEGGGDPPGAGADEDGPGQGDHATPPVGAGPAVRVVGQERDPLAVDRDVDVLEPRVGAGGEGHPEGVFGVRRERVVHHQPAARAVGRALDVVPGVLREVLRVGVGVIHRLSAALADRETADGAGGVQVALEQGRGQCLGFRDVVEVVAHLVERQPVPGVHFKIQQVTDRLSVLVAVEALEGPVSRVGGPFGGLVEPRLQGFHQAQQRLTARAARSGRRHHAGAQLPDHRLGHVRVLRRVRHVELL